jgi:transcriptional regulator with XRE-family HTH domain
MQSCIQLTQYHNFYTNATLYRFLSQREGQMAATGDQIRMARALLKLSIRDLSEITEIDKNTISRIEGGGGAFAATLRLLRSACESRGVLFLNPVEGVHEATVALKWGIAPPARQPGEGTEAGEAGEDGLKAEWDDFEEDADLDALLGEEPAPNPDMAEIWQDDPQAWERLSQIGRETLSRSMFGDCRAAGEGYFRQQL